MTTAVLRFSSLGDVLLCGAVTGGLGPVTFLTHSRYKAAAALLPGVVSVVGYGEDPLPSRVDRVVDLHASPRSRLLARRLGGPVSTVERYDLRRRLRVWLKMGAPPPSVVERYAAAAGVGPAVAPWIRVEGPGDALLLCPGAAHATKRWPADRWVELGRRYAGAVIVLGGPGEEGLVGGIAAEIPGAESLCEAGLTRTLQALGRGRVAVSGDSGLMHLCGAAGVPVVGLFGPTTSADGFFVHAGLAVERSLPCRPCSRFGGAVCPIGDHACLEGLSVEAVWAALCRIEADGGSSAPLVHPRPGREA